MFHLITHAFFKALLFLSAGSVIQGVEAGQHAIEQTQEARQKRAHPLEEHAEPGKTHAARPFDPQDMRNMGGLYQRMPVTFVVYVIGALALAGIVPLAGFWSKDEILAKALGSTSPAHSQPGIYWLLTIAAFLTAFYMGRQVWMVFFGESRSRPAAHARENPLLLTVPLVLLAALSVLGGMLNLPGQHILTTWLGHTLGVTEASGSFNFVVAGISTVLALAGIGLAYSLYGPRFQAQQSGDLYRQLPAARRPVDPLQPYLRGVFTGMQHNWWVDEFYDWLILRRYAAAARFLAQVVDERFWHDWFHDSVIVKGFRWFTGFLAQPVDLGIIDGIANGLAAGSQRLAASMRRMQNGFVRSYAMWIFIGMVVIIGYLIFR
jgi:NADH-quinone oxidoreductase subunit L